MKIVHIESGLGNQMLSYCEYLAIKKMNPNDVCVIETMVYDIHECNDVICQWNGYELGRIFGIEAPNVKDCFDEQTWLDIVAEVRESKFWDKNWNWPVYIAQALNHHGLPVTNIRGNHETKEHHFSNPSKAHLLKRRLIESRLGTAIRRWHHLLFQKNILASVDNRKMLFYKTQESVLTGQRLTFKLRGNDIESLHDEIKRAFHFPAFADTKNAQFAAYLASCNSVFIHARRGDLLSSNGWCYRTGYFRRAVRYIKRRIENPVFVFFTNTGSIEWCKENARIFGLDYKRDEVFFVDWNLGGESFRDMQLMSYCKHGIITNSSFGWWGAYFIENPNKITISPQIEINTTYHC